MAVNDELGVFLNTGILATRTHDVGQLIQLQEDIMLRFLKANFEPAACAEILRAAFILHPALAELFDIESVAEGGCIASKALLYDLHQDRSQWTLALLTDDREPCICQAGAAELPQLGALLRRALQRNEWQPLSEALAEPRLLEYRRPLAAPALSWPEFEGPGVQRLEHASLLISSGTTRVLIDPISLAIGGNVGLPDLNLAPSNLSAPVDAILISHGHLDHWHLPSILRNGGDGGVPVIVPHIPFASLLSQEDMHQSLREVGQAALSPSWGETVQIGDIEIDILPFYGEQPTVGAAVPVGNIRNWGNCYRVTTPQFSVILLVDSGCDAMGSVSDVIDQSLAKRGPPDLILSCCRELPKAPFWQGLFTFWMVLPLTELQQLPQAGGSGDGPSITLGPEGIAETCLRARTPAFAPYANGYCGVGVEISDIGWVNGEPTEAEVLALIEQRIRLLQGETEVIRWVPGDVLRLGEDGRWNASGFAAAGLEA